MEKKLQDKIYRYSVFLIFNSTLKQEEKITRVYGKAEPIKLLYRFFLSRFP